MIDFIWTALTPRQRDVLIGERIFNYTVDWEFDEPCVNALRDKYDEWGILPFYTTDIAAAWQVAETIKDIEIERAGNGWRVIYDGGTFASFAPTAPEAICIAALRIMENVS